MASYRYVVADVFTDRPLTGNALAVFTDARGLDDEAMQSLARETNLSETVFVLPPEQGGTARIRIFTPRAELPFAGHPTLGAAFVLGLPLQRNVIELETLVGIVPVVLERDSRGGIAFGRMTQPVPRVEAVEAGPVLAALGVDEESVLPVERYDNGAQHILVGLESDGGGGGGRAGRRRADRPRRHGRDRLRRRGSPLDGPDVRARAWRARRPGDRLDGRAARVPPLPARPRPVG